MGVRGLTTFLKDNRQSLCRSAQFDQFGNQDAAERVDGEGGTSRPASATASPTPRPDLTIAVIDAWGWLKRNDWLMLSIIYSLYLDSHIPWGSGGEYLRFYRVTRCLIRSWRKVGLEPLFVFDGASPPEKHATTVQRLEKHIASARLFYSTRPASRSRPFGWKDDVILPPFTSHAFIHALESEKVTTHFVPQGEADAMCVVLAERMGGYVFGRDSDYLILSRGGKRLKGYAPLDMLTWIAGAPVAGRAADRDIPDGFKTVYPSRRSQGPRGSPLLPPPDMECPSLVITLIPPQLLCQRLRIPPSVLPLFASLCGNDYTPASVAWHLDDPSLVHTQKIDRIARVIREQYLSQHMSAAHSADRAVEFVNSVVLKLLVRPFDASAQQEALVEALLEATMPYILPSGEVCCDVFPFCGQEPCPRPSTDVSAVSQAVRGRRAYAKAAKRGLIPSVTHGFLYPDRVYLWNVLEDPGMASLKASETLQDVRTNAWKIADEGLDGLTYPEPEQEANENDVGDKENPIVDSAKQVVEHPDDNLDTILGVLDGAPSTSSTTLVDEYIGADEKACPVPESVHQLCELDPDVELPEPEPTPIRQITEWVRSGNRLVPLTRPVPAHSETASEPIALQSLENRVQAYLAALHSDTPLIQALPTALQPLAAGIRTALRLASEREKQSQFWRRNELEAVLRGCIGSWAAWTRYALPVDAAGPAASQQPILTNRNCQLVAQLQAALTDTHLVAQALLLLPPGPDDPPVPPQDRLTHLIPFVFVSGTAIHTLLNGDTPSGDEWSWTAEEGKVYKRVWAAVVDGLEHCLVGLAPRPTKDEVKPLQPSQAATKRSNSSKTQGTKLPATAVKGGRFDLLSQLPS